MRWRRRSDGHLRRAAADRPDGDHHHAGIRRHVVNHLDLEDHLDHVLERILAVELRVGVVRQREWLVRDLIGRQRERREHGRCRHRWRRKLDGPEPAGRWRRRRHAKRRHLHRHQLGLLWLGQRRRRTPLALSAAAFPGAAAASPNRPERRRRSAHLFFGVVPVVVVVVVVFGTAFVTSVALYSTRVPG
ncbi:MAG: hypothetical protein ACLQA5_01230 [Solirubrobacteraceae bacterium]